MPPRLNAAGGIVAAPFNIRSGENTFLSVDANGVVTITGAIQAGSVLNFPNTALSIAQLYVNPVDGPLAIAGRCWGRATTGPNDRQVIGTAGEAHIDGNNTQNWTSARAMLGLDGYVATNPGGVGIVTGAVSVQASCEVQGATITNWYGFHAMNPYGTGVVTNAYGVYVENIVKGVALNYAIYVQSGISHFGAAIDVDGNVVTTQKFQMPNNQDIQAKNFAGAYRSLLYISAADKVIVSGDRLEVDLTADTVDLQGGATNPVLVLSGAGSKSAAAYAAAGTAWPDAGTPAFAADQMYVRINVGGTVYRIPLWADV